jgi:ribosomal-protein-alanine N-acetyltransferase
MAGAGREGQGGGPDSGIDGGPDSGIVRIGPERLESVLPGLLRIEEESFPRPWGAEVFAADLREAGAYLDVLREGGEVAAFCLYRQLYDEVHIIQIATHPDLRRRGLAARLLGHVLAEAARLGCGDVLLEVRRSNGDAIRLYERYGFRQVGVRRRYYQDNGEDALVMRRSG